MRSKIIYLLALILAGAIACQKCEEKVDTEAARAAIETASQEYMAAANRGDAKGVAEIHTADARVLAPNYDIVRGSKAIEEFHQEYIDMGAGELELETVEIEVREGMAVRIGKYTYTIQPTEGETIRESGKFVEIWKPEGGTWKIDVDIWNSSLPAAGQ